MTQLLSTLDHIMNVGRKNNLVRQFTEDESFHGSSLTLHGKRMVNFGTCSYLALESDPRLKASTIDAVERYGTQFSSSRSYLSQGLYGTLEENLQTIFGQPLIVSASTTLGHLATIPVIVEDDDAVILDLQVHASIQMTVQTLKARKIPVFVIRHNCMKGLEEKIKALRSKHKRIWLFADGVYSMYGDYAPLPELENLLNKYPEFHLYIDDAHGMGWTGKNGCGYVRSQMEHHERMVMTVSLNKSFAAAGGAVIFPNEEWKNLVSNCGPTMIFCGPIQPPMLGAACASAQLHLSDEIDSHQEHLADLIAYCNAELKATHLPQYAETTSPLFFIPVGIHPISVTILTGMMENGYFLNAAAFPAVPMKKGGIRFMINAALSKADISGMIQSLKRHYLRAMKIHGSSCEKVARDFGIPEFHEKKEQATIQLQSIAEELTVRLSRSISEIDRDLWDRNFLGTGNLQSANLIMIEKVFSGQDAPENNWEFYYVTIRDRVGEVVLQTFYTSSLMKDDMLEPATVSEKVETLRQKDPYYLTSRCIMLGSPITKGEHLKLDRKHPQWKKALKLLVEKMQETVNAKKAEKLMLRDFSDEKDPELQEVMLDLGLIRMPVPNVMRINDLTWKDRVDYLSRLTGKYRYNVRKEILKYEQHFRLDNRRPQSITEIQAAYELYCQVFDRALDLNVFRMPFEFFAAACKHPDYDILRLYLKKDDGSEFDQPVAVMVSCINRDCYNALLVGLNYEFVRSHNTYKQILYKTVMRAKEVGCKTIDLAFTAELEKKKIGARPHRVCIYAQAIEHYSSAVLQNMAS